MQPRWEEDKPDNASPLYWPTESKEITLWFGRLDHISAVTSDGLNVQGAISAPVYALADGIISRIENNRVYIDFMMEGKYKQAVLGNITPNAQLEPGDVVRRGDLVGHTIEHGLRGRGVLEIELMLSTDGEAVKDDGSNAELRDPALYFDLSGMSLDFLSHPMSSFFERNALNQQGQQQFGEFGIMAHGGHVGLNPDDIAYALNESLYDGEIHLRRFMTTLFYAGGMAAEGIEFEDLLDWDADRGVAVANLLGNTFWFVREDRYEEVRERLLNEKEQAILDELYWPQPMLVPVSFRADRASLPIMNQYGFLLNDGDMQIRNNLLANAHMGVAAEFTLTMTSLLRAYTHHRPDDKFARNQTQWRKVITRLEQYPNYVDTYDYTHGQGVLVFLGAHPAMFQEGGHINRFRHRSLVILVSYETELFNYLEFDPRRVVPPQRYINAGRSVYGDRARVASLGGTAPIVSVLPVISLIMEGGLNMPNDINLSNKTDMIVLNNYILSSPKAQHNMENFVRELFALTRYYNELGNRRPFYAAIPIIRYNSNSWLHGLLLAARVENIPSTSGWSPGWPSPLSTRFFGVAGHWSNGEITVDSTGRVIAGDTVSTVDDISARIADIVTALWHLRPTPKLNTYTVYIERCRLFSSIEFCIEDILYVGRTRDEFEGRQNWILDPIFINIQNVNEAFVLQQILIEVFANQLHYNSRDPNPVYGHELVPIGEAFRIDSTELWRFMGRGGVGDIDTRSQAHTLGEIYASQ